MSTCSLCKKEIKPDEYTVLHVAGYIEPETPISGRFQVETELWLDHWECVATEESKGKWEKLWDALKNAFAFI